MRRDVLGARVGYERLRGNTMELTGVMAGGALVFAGARAPSPARLVQSSLVAQTATRSLGLGCHTGVAAAALAGAAIAQVPVAAALVPWAVIGCVAGRASQGIVNASSAAPGVQASLRRDLPPLAALAGWAVALRASRALGLSVEIVASSLLGGGGASSSASERRISWSSHVGCLCRSASKVVRDRSARTASKS